MFIAKRRAYLNRFQKIINTFAKYGFGHLIHSMGIDELSRHLPFSLIRKENNGKALSKAERFRLVLEELGPTFIKFGQLLSTRPDIIPRDYIEQLRLLQDHVQPFSFTRIKETVEKELKHDLNILFESINEQPLAAASISQVHAAILPGGKKVAVKVQRPEIHHTIEQDLAILKEIGALLDKYTVMGKLYNFSELVDEFALITRLELNFFHEGKNADRLRNTFSNDENIIIPQIHWNYTTAKVLTMEFMEGTTLNQKETLLDRGYSTHKIAEELARAYLRQIMVDGFYHGDPHPGNIGVTADGKLYFLDFGIAGQLSEEQQKHVTVLLQAILEHDTDLILKTITRLGAVSTASDKDELKMELERLQEMYLGLPLKELNLGKVLYELLEISFKLHLRMPREFTVLAKTFLTLEGVISELEPNFSIAELIEQNRSTFLSYHFSRKRLAANAYKNIKQYLHLLEILPGNLTSILEKASGGEIYFKVKVSEMEFLLSRLNSMANRLSFSVVLGSIILGLCLLLQFTEVTLFRQYPVAEVALILAAVMGFWWLWAILRSGRL
ncbi:MAG: AarF/UbiB family protein [Bacillota bacterium]